MWKISKMGLAIKEVLKRKSIGVSEFADMLGINRVSLSTQINGNPTLETLNKWADLLNVDISDLFEKPDRNTLRCPNCGTRLEVNEIK